MARWLDGEVKVHAGGDAHWSAVGFAAVGNSPDDDGMLLAVYFVEVFFCAGYYPRRNTTTDVKSNGLGAKIRSFLNPT